MKKLKLMFGLLTMCLMFATIGFTVYAITTEAIVNMDKHNLSFEAQEGTFFDVSILHSWSNIKDVEDGSETIEFGINPANGNFKGDNVEKDTGNDYILYDYLSDFTFTDTNSEHIVKYTITNTGEYDIDFEISGIVYDTRDTQAYTTAVALNNSGTSTLLTKNLTVPTGFVLSNGVCSIAQTIGKNQSLTINITYKLATISQTVDVDETISMSFALAEQE